MHMHFVFSPEKNEWLQQERGVSFEEVIEILETLWPLSDELHSNTERYPNQRMFCIEIRGYVYRIPYVTDGEVSFLKTIYPSRFDTKQFLSP